MRKPILCLLLFTCLASVSPAQTNGVLPFTGIQYSGEGIFAKFVEVEIDGATLVSNRIPMNKEFTLHLQLPTGFTEDATKKIFPAVEVTYQARNKQVLATVPNLLKELEKTGMPVATMKAIPVKLSLNPSFIKNEKECILLVRYYDLKSKKQLRLTFPVSIAAPGEPIALTKSSSAIATGDKSFGRTNQVKADKAVIMVDTSIRVAPKNAYLSIELPVITGTSMTEVLGGSNNFWVYDQQMNEVKVADKLLKKVGGAMEDNLVNLTVKIPFRMKTDTKNIYTVRYRWESADHKKIIDIVTTR